MKEGFRMYKEHASTLVYKVISGNAKIERIMEEENWSFAEIEADTIFN